MAYTINQIAKLVGISVRALHYYDDIGLLIPAVVKENGYRYYEEKELIRLQQIIFLKSLDFELNDIKRILDDPSFDNLKALENHEELLRLEKARLEIILKTIKLSINKLKGGEDIMTIQTDDTPIDDKIDEYKEEAKARWGNTKEYKQSQERIKNWTKAQINQLRIEGESIAESIALNMDDGIESKSIQALIAKHYEHINKFYDCSLEIYRALGSMYVEDERFAKYYKKYNESLPEFMRNAINYFCDNAHE